MNSSNELSKEKTGSKNIFRKLKNIKSIKIKKQLKIK